MLIDEGRRDLVVPSPSTRKFQDLVKLSKFLKSSLFLYVLRTAPPPTLGAGSRYPIFHVATLSIAVRGALFLEIT